MGLSDQTLLNFRNFGRKSLMDVHGAVAAFLSTHFETRLAEAESVLLQKTQGIDHSSDTSTQVLSSGGWKLPHDIGLRINGASQAPLDGLLTAPVDVLDLSTRSWKVLTELQIGSIAELLAYPQQRIILARNMGRKSLKEIESKVFSYLSNGVVGVYEAQSSELLFRDVREVTQNTMLFEQEFPRTTLDRAESSHFEKRSTEFTEREKQVLTMIFEGLANKQIADRLRISESSVKASLQQLFSKTGVRTRSQLVRSALEQHRVQLLRETPNRCCSPKSRMH